MKRNLISIFILITLFLTSFKTIAAIKLPKLISDGMVLQRDKNIQVWGWANPGEVVNITFNGGNYVATSDKQGKWKTILSPQKAGGPYVMKIRGTNEIVIKDILIGEVWICSGQSNMGFKMQKASKKYAKEIEQSTNPNIRQFMVEEKLSPKKFDDVFSTTGWKKANPENVLKFTAAGYFFAKKLYEQYKVPVGLIMTTFGGTPVDGWISEDGLKSFPDYLEKVNYYKNPAVVEKAINQNKEMIQAWNADIKSKDIGFSSPGKKRTNGNIDVSSWKTLIIPGYWESQGINNQYRLIYFRKELMLPAGQLNKKAVLYLGNIKGEDSTYVNGIKVGFTRNINSTRIYTIPPGLLKAGKNIIMIRVVNMDGTGGFVTDKPYNLQIEGKQYSLSGQWQYKPVAKAKIIPDESQFKEKNIPTLLFNAMISPIINYTFKGVIWYQGEHDINQAYKYRRLFPALINDWRKQFNQGEFPFLYAQLPAYSYGLAGKDPEESAIAEMREAQAMAHTIPNTGMIVTLDIGEYNDIHPQNKLDVGIRFSLLARKLAYNEKDIVASGPSLKSSKIEGNKIILTFNNIGSGLIVKGSKDLHMFAIAGSDKKYYWAKAQIQGDKVIVWSEKVSNPVAVRYAWVNDTSDANLYNREGLPAAAFRTDDWTHVTKASDFIVMNKQTQSIKKTIHNV